VPRIFLDANVLFSAAYREGAGLLRLWEAREAEVITSGYAAEEARRNLETPAARARLAKLLQRTNIVAEAPETQLPDSIRLAEKDRPILQAAIAGGATHLITGDRRDFGAFLGKSVAGVRVETPADFLRQRERTSRS
jgi:predicted nucleic acid-binding protein